MGTSVVSSSHKALRVAVVATVNDPSLHCQLPRHPQNYFRQRVNALRHPAAAASQLTSRDDQYFRSAVSFRRGEASSWPTTAGCDGVSVNRQHRVDTCTCCHLVTALIGLHQQTATTSGPWRRLDLHLVHDTLIHFRRRNDYTLSSTNPEIHHRTHLIRLALHRARWRTSRPEVIQWHQSAIRVTYSRRVEHQLPTDEAGTQTAGSTGFDACHVGLRVRQPCRMSVLVELMYHWSQDLPQAGNYSN